MNLLVVGAARRVWYDLHDAPSNSDIMAINWTAMIFKTVKHIASQHVEILKPLKELTGATTHSNHEGADHIWDFNLNGGSSGCFGAAVGVALGYDKVILCGCPADNTGNFYDPPWLPGNFSHKRKVWKYAKENYFHGKVFSMSGWTRELLGGPY